MSEEDRIICQECLKDGKSEEDASYQSLGIHVKKHGISGDEYKEKYDVEYLQSKSLRKKQGVTLENMIKKYGEEEGRERYNSYVEKQRKTAGNDYFKSIMSDEEYEEFERKRSNAQKLQGFIEKYGPELGPKKHEEYIEYRREVGKHSGGKSMPGGQNPMSYQYLKLNSDMSDEEIEKLFKRKNVNCTEFWTSRGYNEEEAEKMADHNNPMKVFFRSLTPEEKEEWLKKVSRKHSKVKKEMYDSLSPEERTEYWSKRLPGPRSSVCEKFLAMLDSHFEIERESCVCDILIDGKVANHDVVIEFYGNYWHCHPGVFGPEDFHEQIGMCAEDVWKRDRDKIRQLTTNGVSVIIVWEHEFYDNSEELVDRTVHQIKEAIHDEQK